MGDLWYQRKSIGMPRVIDRATSGGGAVNVATFHREEDAAEAVLAHNTRRELIDAAQDFAHLTMIENFSVNDVAMTRAYERLRKAIDAAEDR